MRLFLLTSLTMVAFAANSVLNRLALASGEMDAFTFGTIRLTAGALVLTALVLWKRRGFAIGGAPRLWAVLSLLIYIFGFSAAYADLAPGFGALILFSVVQVTMFTGAVLSRDHLPMTRWVGAGLALGGLAWLLWPSGTWTASLPHVMMMAAAGVGWGLYSLLGRRERDPLQATAMNFLFAAPCGIALLLALGGAGSLPVFGVVLAALSGAVTSGVGYALWYYLLPDLGAARAAVAQLTVPVIALAGGMAFLDETLTLRFALASVLVMAGVLVSLRRG